MSPTDTLVLAWHGSRNPAGKALIERITARVAGLLPGVTVHTAWVDIEPELLPETLARVGACTVVPCFLASGYHVTHDVPQAAASVPWPVQVTPHLGGSLHHALLDRVAEAGGPGDAVVLAAAGSKSATALAEVDAVAVRLAAALGVPVVVGNIYLSEPSVAEAVATLLQAQALRQAQGTEALRQAQGSRQAQGTDVLVLPYTLAPGLWCERIAGLGVRVAEPLGDHADVAAGIAGRYLASDPADVRLLLSLES